MYPRKDLITDPYNSENIIIQDDQYPPDCYTENSFHCSQPRLQSPFHFHPSVQLSPPSSTPSSPTFSSPTFSTSYPPTSNSQSLGALSMTPASSYDPSFDYQGSSSPSHYLPQYPQQYYTPMLAQQPIANNQGWDSNLQLLSPARIPYAGAQKKSSPSASSRSHPTVNNYHRRSDSSNKPLPTPVQTPVQNSFLATPFQNFDPASQDAHNVEAESAMRKAIIDQQKQSPSQQMQNDYSLAPSVSTVSHNSPVTPQNSFDELDDAKSMPNGENRLLDIDRWMDQYLQLDAPDYNNSNGAMSVGIPKLDRTISDIYQDELYNPAVMAAPQMSKPMSRNQLTPRNLIADRLQAANQGHMSARSQSPANGRDRSPFRPHSPFAGDMGGAALQQPPMATSVPMGHNGMNDVNGMSGMNMSQTPNTGDIKTMSPKDAVLDFQDGDDAMPSLFPPGQGDFNLGDALGLRRDSGSMRPMEALPQYTAPTMSQPQFAFAQPQIPQSQSNLLQQSTEFPSLPVVESSEATPQSQINMPNTEVSRPANTSSDAGTYTCTYHNCSQRFETPSRLQRHKREAHRQTTPGGHPVSRDTSLRNSQAGPHKCERINPSTGKPCNSIFSRPYDLTRHEHTIHTAGKQKVRCHICNEDKTFSRNDALTRHMRVVHPEVDWPGKQRRRRD
ncbi:hypothetical protein N7535_000404 [Penicillium sp. DV-2018c]|nr:hypothetical protein N7535_000404 [Penicillium sp. DV-2018c]